MSDTESSLFYQILETAFGLCLHSHIQYHAPFGGV